MATLPVFDASGKKVREISVSSSVFGLVRNNDLLHQVYTVLAGNMRVSTAHTKNRSERAGSGRKPWKQKGTGRARAGSVRSPIWRKGGIVFGPRNEKNYTRKVNVKMRRKAIAAALSEKTKENVCAVLEISETVAKKTKDFSRIFGALPFTGSVLFGAGKEEKDLLRYVKNIRNVSELLAEDFNAYVVLNAKNIILTEQAVRVLEHRLGDKKSQNNSLQEQ